MDKDKEKVLTIKKVKKDGSIDFAIIERVQHQFSDKSLIILPVDSIYGFAIKNSDYEKNNTLLDEFDATETILISSFKMLDDIAGYNKLEYDFLHRIWPGEINVLLKSKDSDDKISVRMPRARYILDLLELVDEPVVYKELINKNGLIYEEKKIVTAYKDKVDFIFIVKEFCKEHQAPTVVDVSEGELTIRTEGKVPVEEIKSLYFLGTDDALV